MTLYELLIRLLAALIIAIPISLAYAVASFFLLWWLERKEKNAPI